MTITDPNPGLHARIVPMDDVLDGDSVDLGYVEGAGSAKDVIPNKRLDPGYLGLLDSIRTHGFDPRFAPAWDEWNGVQEGHHRIAALIELGARWCPVQEDRKRGEYFELPDGTRPGACAYHTKCPDGPEEGGCWYGDEGDY